MQDDLFAKARALLEQGVNEKLAAPDERSALIGIAKIHRVRAMLTAHGDEALTKKILFSLGHMRKSVEQEWWAFKD